MVALNLVTKIRMNLIKGGRILAYDIAMNINTNDLILKDRDLILIDNAENVAQGIVIALRFWLGEWFLDTKQGVPYLERILVKNPNENHIRQVFTEAIQKVPGVQKVLEMGLYYSPVERALVVEYAADTLYGLLTRKEVLGYGE